MFSSSRRRRRDERGSVAIQMVFLMPALLLGIFWVIDWVLVRDSPAQAEAVLAQAGVTDFDAYAVEPGRDPLLDLFLD